MFNQHDTLGEAVFILEKANKNDIDPAIYAADIEPPSYSFLYCNTMFDTLFNTLLSDMRP